MKPEIDPISKNSELPNMAKTAFLELLNSPKLISRKIWTTEIKSWNFHIVFCTHFGG